MQSFRAPSKQQAPSLRVTHCSPEIWDCVAMAAASQKLGAFFGETWCSGAFFGGGADFCRSRAALSELGQAGPGLPKLAPPSTKRAGSANSRQHPGRGRAQVQLRLFRDSSASALGHWEMFAGICPS